MESSNAKCPCGGSYFLRVNLVGVSTVPTTTAGKYTTTATVIPAGDMLVCASCKRLMPLDELRRTAEAAHVAAIEQHVRKTAEHSNAEAAARQIEREREAAARATREAAEAEREAETRARWMRETQEASARARRHNLNQYRRRLEADRQRGLVGIVGYTGE